MTITVKLERHHPKGRWGPGKRYVDPGNVIALTKDQHDRLHVALRAAGLEFPTGLAAQEGTGEHFAYLLQRLDLQLKLLVDMRDEP